MVEGDNRYEKSISSYIINHFDGGFLFESSSKIWLLFFKRRSGYIYLTWHSMA